MEEAEKLAQYLRLESLWRFEFECVHESCGQRHTIYTIGKRDIDALDLLNAILHIVPPPHWHVDKGFGMPSFPSQKIQEQRFDYDF
ncbi:MAG: hypothetical protein DMG72_11055 [Acidobacteria bacterium]|nr:MAG: hypothetical protein DMG72_11055 [Acidobacteriota bacterium]